MGFRDTQAWAQTDPDVRGLIARACGHVTLHRVRGIVQMRLSQTSARGDSLGSQGPSVLIRGRREGQSQRDSRCRTARCDGDEGEGPHARDAAPPEAAEKGISERSRSGKATRRVNPNPRRSGTGRTPATGKGQGCGNTEWGEHGGFRAVTPVKDTVMVDT